VPLLPFLKWPGGKRWFVSHYADLLPKTFGRYYEPFLGAGSVFFHLQPERAILKDTNRELIAVYKAVAWYRKQLEALLQLHHENHGKRYYYRVRANIPDDPVARAARTLYLNRTCFNGMYRVTRTRSTCGTSWPRAAYSTPLRSRSRTSRPHWAVTTTPSATSSASRSGRMNAERTTPDAVHPDQGMLGVE
jgi:DNA adenine methylase Dam